MARLIDRPATHRLAWAIVLLVLCVSMDALAEESARSPKSEVDASTLERKVMCGYQGWFNCEGDGAHLGWTHWARDRGKPLGPGNVTVDLWPDVSELSDEETFSTAFRHADGRVAKVFSSASPETVATHFRWMQEYGIDGIFLQRFANGLDDGLLQRHKDQVLASVRTSAERMGRVYAVMYDLSGLRTGQTDRVRRDWQHLVSVSKITDDSRYLHHRGKPVVAVWGIGFNDGRRYSLQECLELVTALKDAGCTVLIGVPSWWREGVRDAVDDPLLLEIVQRADIVCPWSVGRYRTPDEAIRHAAQVWQSDLVWCQQRHLDYLPVVFPGFSWHNLKGAELDLIPRRRGDFLWSQVFAAKRAGCQMLYVAMFDEVDEGTAIFKCTGDPPVGPGASFLDYEGLPSDYYLRLVGQAARVMRGERQVTREQPPLP
jgi:YD repeat-containing protein